MEALDPFRAGNSFSDSHERTRTVDSTVGEYTADIFFEKIVQILLKRTPLTLYVLSCITCDTFEDACSPDITVQREDTLQTFPCGRQYKLFYNVPHLRHTFG